MNYWDQLLTNTKTWKPKDRLGHCNFNWVLSNHLMLPYQLASVAPKMELWNLSSKYDINITKNNQIGNIDKYVVNGIVNKLFLKQILEDLKTINPNPLNRTVLSHCRTAD